MNYKKVLLNAILGCLISVFWGNKADAKTAVVELDVLVQAHPDTEPNNALLESQKNDIEAEINEMLNEYKVMKEAFDLSQRESNNPALSDDAREEKLRGLQKSYKVFIEFDKEYREIQLTRQKELSDRQQRMYLRTVKKIKAIVAEYAEKEEYLIVINLGDEQEGVVGPVIYSTDTVNITSDIRLLIKEQVKR